jgi:hypothetical protein
MEPVGLFEGPGVSLDSDSTPDLFKERHHTGILFWPIDVLAQVSHYDGSFSAVTKGIEIFGI